MLPSTEAYQKFNEANNSCTADKNLPTEIDGELPDGVKKGKYADKLKKVWCYVSEENIEESTLSKEQRYGFLYYYIGHMIYDIDEIDDSSFKNIMDKVLGKLKTLPNGSECNVERSPFGKFDFDSERKIYDYYVDYNKVKSELNKDKETPCSEKLVDYLDEVATAYSIIEWRCPIKGTSVNAYCEKFNGEYKELIRDELLKSKCTSEKARGYLRDAEGANAAAAAAISSILGIVGLPVTAFFLHKYNRLPPWISHYFGVGRSSPTRSNRGKRRSGARSWDTLTDNESTIGSTVASTSNLSRTTTDNSTTYNGRPRPSPPGQRGRNNRQQRQRNNINYGRM
ncbi:KIR protein [Plasmodium coatneyi]|uniref:KIR protein n=1 Tax=Plasmodium coatneyi TaxID=208452 RepID=A0A1B1E8S2_9APIC|nr:KIR protein [Plasmodium coatneyi]ANQ11169.1 KIR protein [Plasmodium coatneyi]